jgi:hypothetical protein
MRRQIVWETCGIFRRLRFHARQRAFGFCLDRSQGLPIDVQHVVGKSKARFHLELADRNAAASREIDILEILNEPPCGSQVCIDFAPCALFRRLGHAG